MIHVTQGHESGIGLEAFIKSLLAINLSLAESFILHVEEESLKKNLEFLNIDYSLSGDFVEFEDRTLKLSLIKKANEPLSTLSLESALNLISNEDVLFTLPTSKDQLLYGGQRCSGYTEYFRARFGIQSLVMIFKCQEGFTGLLTDHIPLRLVSEVITEDLVCEKFNIIRNELKKYYKKDFEYIFSGINPHSGEGGILGDEDGVITKAIGRIQSDHPDLKVIGPL
ncbi:MAG: 4-hydroxythreonine-4-phosphate dehydrogenase PdxA, partial [Halobacteriovoraceae bacterium]|nr:4-hydroxythreonine-4-phosphate dehydrogenase PdxA [Halobacteriovoraceae bacterium]